MKASIVDLRRKMREILKALKRNEEVQILYHGKVAGTIVPVKKKKKIKMRVQDHPFFGMERESYRQKSVDDIMNDLRGGRYRAI